MLRQLLTRFWGEASDAEEESDDEGGSRFVPSRLDASVLYAHGMGHTYTDYEMMGGHETQSLVEEQRRRHE